MISTKGRYALRMMIEIGRHSNGAPVSLKDISKRQGISVKYLEQVASILSKSGYIRSVRGNAGGYMLCVNPNNCTVGEVLRACEGSLAPVSCLKESHNTCERSAYCETLEFWQGLYSVINEYIDSVTIQDLIDKTNGKSFNYII